MPSASARVASSAKNLPPDDRLLRRRDCEFELFRSVERAICMPRIRDGFTSIEQFVQYAHSVTNRRKSRSGASLGLHADRIFDEEHLPHDYYQVSEGKKRPDFLFPSSRAYREAKMPERLVVLAAKTTCKDRWRQILNEAHKTPVKYLLTLQEGVSRNQFKEMDDAGVVLVVPRGLQTTYHPKIAPQLLSLERFIDLAKARCLA